MKRLAAILAMLCMCALSSCSMDTTVDSFVVDDTYCANYPDNCAPNDSTGVPEIYCGRNHSGTRCDCEVDLIGRPMAVRECQVWTR